MSKEKKKILLVEDDKFICRICKNCLERSGFEVITAEGVEAIEKMKKQKPDLVLLDLVMPDKNGFEVLGEIKMDSELKKIPVIILPNLGQNSDIKKGRELGAVDYLIKTDFKTKEVIEKVKFYLAKFASAKTQN
ncbi:response regulator [Patescibacteria group bacterium]|nr:response regulator [Patescibacteria group bacterium]